MPITPLNFDWKSRLLLVGILTMLSACATITKDTTQDIAVTTTPTGANCTLTNKAGSWNLTTPGTAKVKRNYSPLEIHCTKGTLRATTTLEPKTRGRAYGNILLGGAPAIVDAETGAGYEYEPTSVTLELKP